MLGSIFCTIFQKCFNECPVLQFGRLDVLNLRVDSRSHVLSKHGVATSQVRSPKTIRAIIKYGMVTQRHGAHVQMALLHTHIRGVEISDKIELFPRFVSELLPGPS